VSELTERLRNLASSLPIIIRPKDAEDIREAGREIERLIAIVDRLSWLNDNSYDLRCIDVPTGGDDYDVEWVVISHHMDKPREREVGRGWSADEALRIAAEKASRT
jgi:hypothetical protein